MSDEEGLKLHNLDKLVKLYVSSQLVSSYLNKPVESKTHEVIWDSVKTASEYLTKHLK